MNDKLNEFLKANGSFEEVLKKHVLENATDIVADKILNGKKDMSGCANYIMNEAKKLAKKGCAVISDPTVYAMAIEYFNNDDIKAEQSAVKLITPTVHTPEPKEIKKVPPKPKKVKKVKVVEEEAPSLFDLLG